MSVPPNLHITRKENTDIQYLSVANVLIFQNKQKVTDENEFGGNEMGHQCRFVQFYFTALFPVHHIYSFLSFSLDKGSGLAHSKEDIKLVFSSYENEFPRHGGHGHSSSCSCFFVLCITSL